MTHKVYCKYFVLVIACAALLLLAGPTPLSGSDMAELFLPGSLSPSLTIVPHQSPSSKGLSFFVTMKDQSDKPLFATRSQVTAWFQGNPVACSPVPPASDAAVERDNQKAIQEKRYDDLRFDRWAYCTKTVTAALPLTFGVIVAAGDHTYRNLFSQDASSRDARALQGASRDINDTIPPADLWSSWVVAFSLNSQTYNPGDTVTANIVLYNTPWSQAAYVACSFADPQSITVDGVPTPGEPGTAAFYPRWTLPPPYFSVLGPSYRVYVVGPGPHTVTFKLDPQYTTKLFTFDGTTYTGPFASVGLSTWWSSGWDWDIGFVITGGNPPSPEAPGFDHTNPYTPPESGCATGTPSSIANAKSGNNFVTHTDLSHNSLGPSFEFSRAYSSLWSYSGPMGYGWTHRYNTSLKLNDDGSVVESDEVGTPYRYTIQSAGAYTAPPGRNATLVRNADGSFVLTEKDQLVKKFSAAGVLLSLTDANGNAMTMGYDPSGKLMKITDAAGREALLSYTAEGKIAEISDPAQRKVKYFYDADSNMVRVNDVSGLDTVYEYTAHKLTKITMFNGKTYTYSYDSQGRLVSRTDMANQQMNISYDPVTKTSTVRDKRGNTTVYTMDDQGRQVSVVDPTGAETRQTWDANNNITSLTEPRGGVQEFTHDSRGNVLTHKDQLGQVTTYTYTDKNQVATVKDALGKTQQFVYDAKSNLLKVIDPRGNTVVSYTYNNKGERTSTTDMRGNTTRFEMDQYGNVVKEIDALGHETRHTFDIVDRMTGTINAKGKTTSFTYGVKDQLLTTTYPDGTSTTNEWYPCGALLKSVTDANHAATVYNYNAQRQLIKVTDAAQGITQFELDENGNRTAIIDPKGSRTGLVYDKANRLEKIEYPDGTSEAITYYPGGLLKTKTDGNGAVISLEYDPAGRMTRKSYPDGSDVQFAYNAVGVRTSMTDASGTYRYTVDDLYRLTGVTLPSGKKIGYSYNNAGQRVGMTDYDSKQYAYQYDKLNRLKTLTLPGNEKVDYSYDSLSALSKVSHPNNTFTSYTLDTMNRVKEIATYRKGHFKNTLLSSFSYSHDLVGNVISREERSPCGRPQKTLFTYDPLYRLASVAYPDKSEVSYTYDLASNRATRETKKLHLASCFNGWKWDEKGCRDLVRCLFHPEYITFRAHYNYDSANKLLGIEETKLFRNRTRPYKTTVFEFDRNGNQVRESILNEGCTKAAENLFAYNADNRLIEARMKGIKKYQFSYDGEGRRYRTLVESVKSGGGHHASRCLGESQETGHLYDGSSLIMDIDAKGRPTASYSYGLGLTGITAGRFKGYYHADALGSITEITGKEGNPLRSYRYDAWGEMTAGETAHDVNPFRYVGAYGVRWQDSTLGMYHMNRRFYNPCAGRFISRDLQDPHPYTYALNNPIIYVDPSGRSASLNPQTVITAITIMMSQPETVPVIGSALIMVYVVSQAGDPHQNANTVYSSISGNDSYSGGNVIPLPNSAPFPVVQPLFSGGGNSNWRNRRCKGAYDACLKWAETFFGNDCKLLDRCERQYKKCLRFPGELIGFPQGTMVEPW